MAAVLLAGGIAVPSAAAGWASRWIHQLAHLRLSAARPIIAVEETITPDVAWLQRKLAVGSQLASSGIEPLQLRVVGRSSAWLAARMGASPEAAKQLEEVIARQHGSGAHEYLNLADLPRQLWSPTKVLALFADRHHRLVLQAGQMDETARQDMLGEVQPLLSRRGGERLASALARGRDIDLSRTLFEGFSSRVLGRFVPYRGPNCFHAALAFHNFAWTRDRHTNINRKQGYHWAMINYDELWRKLRSDFYPVAASRYPLRFGDLMIYFDLPPEYHTDEDPYFRWISHAAVYLSNDFVFSKGSKSSVSSYAVRRIEDEWARWSRRATHRTGVLVFRSRAPRTLATAPPLSDWWY